MDVGTTLRLARERRNLSLAQLAATTKIPVGVLRSLEDNAFEKVSGGIFIRGFLRSYAREVGLDPEETIDAYLEQTEQTAPRAAMPPALADHSIEEDIESLQIDPDVADGSRPGWGYALIVAALVVGFVSFNRSGISHEAPPASPAVADATAVSALDTITTAASELHPVATTGGVLRFEMQTDAPCWVRAVVDGKTVVARLMQPGEREAIDAQHDVIVRVGDPGAFRYSINGRPGRTLGSAGVPVTVRFTTDGQQDRLAS